MARLRMNVLVVLLCIYLVCIALSALHLLLFKFHRKRLSPLLRSTLVLRLLPAACILASFALIIVVQTSNHDHLNGCPEEDLQINSDIGGIGVLLEMILPCAILLLVLFSGHWSSATFGAKELCMAQLANLVYLAVNLAKSRSSLNVREILIACSSIDAVSASTSMAYSDKDVLASRKLVFLGFVIQLAAFITEGIGLNRLPSFQDSTCVISLRHPVFNNFPGALIWTYLVVRVLMAFALVPTMAPLTEQLDIIERTKGVSLQVQKARQWELLPATLFTNYIVFFSFVSVHAVAAFSISSEVAVTKSWETLWTEWGQSASFVVATGVIGHVCSSFCRLFSSEALDHRIRVATAINGPTSWATPRRSWWTWHPWGTLRQRQPFGKVALNPPDGLLVDYAQLLQYEQQQIFKTEKERMELWDELLLSFELNDREGIMDCLHRGAPVDRHDKLGEYPIHKAARFGDIYMLQSTNLPMTSEQLMKKNNASETPLKVAVTANRINAVRWILEPLKQTVVTKEINAAVMETFDIAIMEERDDLLVCLISSWPDWKKMARADSENSHVHFAILQNKVQAAGVLSTHGGISSCENGENLTPLEYALVTGTDDMIKAVFKPYPDSNEIVSIETLEKGLKRGLFQTLLTVGIDPSTLFNAAVRVIDRPCDMIEALMNQDLSMQALDTELICLDHELEYALDVSEIIKRCEQLSATFLQKGARSWAAFFGSAERNDYPELEKLLVQASATGSLKRMMTATLEGGQSAPHMVFSHLAEELFHSRIDTKTKTIDVLLSYGADFGSIDGWGNTALHLAAEDSFCRTTHILQLLKVISPTDINRVDRSGCTVLHCAYECYNEDRSEGRIGRLLRKLNAFLKHGANPTLIGSSGYTPQELANDLRRHFVQLSLDQAYVESTLEHIIALLQRWEAFQRDPTMGSPQNDPHPEWDSESEDGESEDDDSEGGDSEYSVSKDSEFEYPGSDDDSEHSE